MILAMLLEPCDKLPVYQLTTVWRTQRSQWSLNSSCFIFIASHLFLSVISHFSSLLLLLWLPPSSLPALHSNYPWSHPPSQGRCWVTVQRSKVMFRGTHFGFRLTLRPHTSPSFSSSPFKGHRTNDFWSSLRCFCLSPLHPLSSFCFPPTNTSLPLPMLLMLPPVPAAPALGLCRININPSLIVSSQWRWRWWRTDPLSSRASCYRPGAGRDTVKQCLLYTAIYRRIYVL